MAKSESIYGIGKMPGPLATVYSCPCCKFVIRVPRGRGQGRGHGLRSGGAAFSKMVAHVRATHPSQPREASLAARPVTTEAA